MWLRSYKGFTESFCILQGMIVLVGLEEVQYGSKKRDETRGILSWARHGHAVIALLFLEQMLCRRRRHRAERQGNMYRSTRLGDRTGAESASESGKPSPCPGDVLCTGWVTLPFLAGRHPRRHQAGLVIRRTLYVYEYIVRFHLSVQI